MADQPNRRHVEITDVDCPRGTIYRLTADYARTVPRWADQVPDDALTVLVRHPLTPSRDVPVFDSTIGGA